MLTSESHPLKIPVPKFLTDSGKETVLNGHIEKALSPIVESLLVKLNVPRLEHSRNASSQIVVKLLSFGIETFFKFLQPANARSPILVIDLGKYISLRLSY
jgi:hypothetical protein